MRTTARDVSSDVSRELAFGLLTVITLIPMTLFVFLLSFFWIVILLLLGRAQNLNTRGGRFQFGVAVVIFYVIKTAAFAPLLRSPSLLQNDVTALGRHHDVCFARADLYPRGYPYSDLHPASGSTRSSHKLFPVCHRRFVFHSIGLWSDAVHVSATDR